MQVANGVASANELPSCEARPGRCVNNSAAAGKLQGGELREDCVEGGSKRDLTGKPARPRRSTESTRKMPGMEAFRFLYKKTRSGPETGTESTRRLLTRDAGRGRNGTHKGCLLQQCCSYGPSKAGIHAGVQK